MTKFTSIEELLSQSVPSASDQYTANLRNLALRAYDRQYRSVRSKRFLFQRKQILGCAGVLAFVIFAFLTFTSTGRVLAQQILQFGLFIFTNGPTQIEKQLTSTPESSPIPSHIRTVRTELAQASEVAGFPIYYPSYLPEEYTPISRQPGRPVEVLFNSSGEVIKVEAMFERTRNGEILSFSQIPLDLSSDVSPFKFGTGQVEPQFVNVAGNEGVWLEDFTWGSKLDESGNSVPVPYNLLIWEITTENGDTFQFWLGSEERLPLDVMLRIADSVVQ